RRWPPGSPQFYRIEAKTAKLSVSFPRELAQGHVQAVHFEPGPGTKAWLLDAQGQPIDTLMSRMLGAVALSFFPAWLEAQKLEVPLSLIQIPDFRITSIAPAGPTRWYFLTLIENW